MKKRDILSGNVIRYSVGFTKSKRPVQITGRNEAGTMSQTRKRYMIRLIARSIIFLLCAVTCILKPESFSVLDGWNFFDRITVFHALWGIWCVDMFLQIVPIKNRVALGSQKLFANRFRPIRDKINYQALKDYVVSTTHSALMVMVLWLLLIVVIGVLYFTDVIGKPMVFTISVAFYVCDLICVLIWCPFRLIMKNKCCTTCRIFNWDHVMMFSPLIFLGGFYCISLLAMALLALVVWEICILVYPERFWEMTNSALKCSECTDKLCTQYCQKLRKRND